MRTFRTVLEQRIWQRRQTFEEFAEFAETFAREHGEPGTLGVRHLQRLASGRGPKGQPLGPVRPPTARLLERIFGIGIDELLTPPVPHEPDRQAGSVDGSTLRATHMSGDIATIVDWLDDRAGRPADTTRQEVISILGELDTGYLLDRQARRAKVRRGQIAIALSDYYQCDSQDHIVYQVRCGDRRIATSIITCQDWLDLACPLTAENDRLSFVNAKRGDCVDWTEFGSSRAAHRLAEVVALNVRVANMPLYRLLSIDLGSNGIRGTVGLTSFIEYALTADLLEIELIDAVIATEMPSRAELPLRAAYLPDLATVLDIAGRACVGGALSLCAIARPFDPYRGEPDYALLVQERSPHVLNSARRLAVIPKAFHQPLKDVRADARIGATLLREMEEELFGRSEVDSTIGGHRVAAPMHPSRLSEPMRWLMDDPDRLRMECTGFGLNLVSGNYEFASLIVINDEEFWSRYGGQVEANWEAEGLRLYSSQDRELLTELIFDESWSNEGLFALIQGLQRLEQICGDRVSLPLIERDQAKGSR